MTQPHQPQSSGASDSLADSQLNQSIIEGIGLPLIALDASFNIMRSNKRFLDVFQISIEDASTALSKVFPDGRLQSLIERTTESKEDIREAEFECEIGDDGQHHFLLSISNISLPDGQAGVLVTFDEVTEWKHRHSQVMEASRLVSIGEMAAGIAHEINNPLAAVMGFTQLVMRRDVDDRVMRDLEKILAESKRASKIITNLQSFARRYKPKKDPVNFISIVKKVLEFRSYEMEVENITVQTNFESTTAMVLGDQHQLDQVLLNLVINAEHFMYRENGGGTLTIDVASKGDKIVISITDDGPGIDPEDIPKIFDPFFTTKEVGQGTGLGLSICYGIVHEHNGTIEVVSQPGKGTTFTVTLEASDMPSSGSGSSGSGLPKGLSASRVLLVDDEPAISEFISRALQEEGCIVEVVSDGAEIINRTDFAGYDLFILDVRMPGVGGSKIYEHISETSPELSNRVMFITGDTTARATKELIEKTSNPILVKPFTIEDLVTSVRRISMAIGQKV